MSRPVRSGNDTDGLEELLHTLRDVHTHPHGRTERFEDSFQIASSLEALEGAPRLHLGPLIAQGGMGKVHLATQAVLDRQVAVKTLHAANGPSSIERFLQEARITGLIEHPNVVPVYDLVVAEGGAPALVMKRIAGVPWSQMLRDPASLPSEDAGDPLAWHLAVLMSLCDAAQYAHDNGIVHRDIKPGNVMIGSFGETYLLDWGLAVSLREEHAGFIALAREGEGLVGTPAYMAPEMAQGDGTAISPATDVFLLGATLHEIVTGSPPYAGEQLYAVLKQAFEAAPREYPSSVPSELASICREAMAREPGDRFASAAELRAALERFLTHRESHALAQAGREALTELERRVEEAPANDSAVEDLFGAVRFSLGQAIQLWPNNEDARAAWERALRRMARYELARGREAAAAALVAEQSGPDEEVTAELARLRAAREKREVEVGQLRELQREHDVEVSGATRSRAALLLGVLWFLVTAGAGRLQAWGLVQIDYPMFLAGAALLVVMVVALRLARPELLANEVNRRTIVALTTGALASLLGRVVAVVYEQDVGISFAREQLIYAMTAALIAISTDLRILGAVACFVVTAVACTAWPQLAFELGGLGVLVSTVWVSFVWRVPR